MYHTWPLIHSAFVGQQKDGDGGEIAGIPETRGSRGHQKGLL